MRLHINSLGRVSSISQIVMDFNLERGMNEEVASAEEEEVDLTNDGDEMEWHGLQSLRYLWFYDLPNLATLPEGIQHLTSLQSLEIGRCPSLLAIPEWICNLTSLQKLEIWECPILSKRCGREAGEDWSKIAHIPHLNIR